MSLTVTFSNWITFAVVNEYGKGAVVETESMFRQSLAVNVLTNSLTVFHVINRNSFQLNYLQRVSMSLRLKQYFAPFTTLPLKWSSEMVLIRYLSNDVLRSLAFRKYISYEEHLFLRMFKIWCRFDKWTKKCRKSFLFDR